MVLALLGFVIALTGITAAALYAFGIHAAQSPLAALAPVSVLRMLIPPSWP
jgi:hypothetical protein